LQITRIVSDEAGLKKQALDGARIGFTGKQIIHPGQIPVVQKCFSPSEEKVEWARELIRTFEESPEVINSALLWSAFMFHHRWRSRQNFWG